MSPKELRAFRESIGMSRREFAPKVFISEPTLVRWERGQGGPREVHLLILRRMREHLGAGHSLAYFQYDADADVPAELLHDDRQLIIDTLKSRAVVLLEEHGPDDGGDWLLRFSLGWAAGEPIDLVLLCEGSERPSRPIIDFSLEITADWGDGRHGTEVVARVCRAHRVAWGMTVGSKGRCTATIFYRLFSVCCNPEAVKHVLGNYQSCWSRLKKEWFRRPSGPARENVHVKEAVSCPTS